MVRLLSVYNNKSLLLVSEKKLTLNRDVFTSRASVVMDYNHRERIFFCWWRKKRVNEGWIEGWNFFYKLLRLSRKNHKLRCRKGLVMWESYVNCGRTECPYFSSKIKGVAEWGSQTKGWRGESPAEGRKKNCDLTGFDGGSGHWRAQTNFGWFSWSSRCVWVAVVTVLAVVESRRVFSSWTHWHPSNSSSEDGKETVLN